jgi:hypothetical protein
MSQATDPPARGQRSRSSDPKARAVRRLSRTWHRQASVPYEKRKTIYDLPLPAVLLTGITISEDEGPVLDALAGLYDTIDGWRRAAGDVDVVSVSLAEVMMVARRVDVVRELIRRGA